jgi:hypothetical protein
MFTNIPEDSMLRRHYLTELKYKQEGNFEAFINATKVSKVALVQDTPVQSSNRIYVFVTAFLIVGLLLLF